MIDRSIREIQRRMKSDPESISGAEVRSFERIGVDLIGDHARAMEGSKEVVYGTSCYTIDDMGRVVAAGCPVTAKELMRAFSRSYRSRVRPVTVGNIMGGSPENRPFFFFAEPPAITRWERNND